MASFFIGPSGETRTRGILLPKQARYQLRYTWIFSSLVLYTTFQEKAITKWQPGDFRLPGYFALHRAFRSGSCFINCLPMILQIFPWSIISWIFSKVAH